MMRSSEVMCSRGEFSEGAHLVLPHGPSSLEWHCQYTGKHNLRERNVLKIRSQIGCFHCGCTALPIGDFLVELWLAVMISASPSRVKIS